MFEDQVMREMASAPVAELRRTYPWIGEMPAGVRDGCMARLRDLARGDDFSALASAMLAYSQEYPVPSRYSDDGELLVDARG